MIHKRIKTCETLVGNCRLAIADCRLANRAWHLALAPGLPADARRASRLQRASGGGQRPVVGAGSFAGASGLWIAVPRLRAGLRAGHRAGRCAARIKVAARIRGRATASRGGRFLRWRFGLVGHPTSDLRPLAPGLNPMARWQEKRMGRQGCGFLGGPFQAGIDLAGKRVATLPHRDLFYVPDSSWGRRTMLDSCSSLSG